METLWTISKAVWLIGGLILGFIACISKNYAEAAMWYAMVAACRD